MRGDGLAPAHVALLALAFVLTRAVLHLSGLPYFDPDSYKYLAGADSLLAGNGLPALYTEVPVAGGALHVVPGYAHFVAWVWQVTGVTIDGLAIVQSAISLLGYLALAHLLSLWLSRGVGVAAFLVLALSPSIAWLEHSIMPDSIAAPMLMIAFWAAVVGGPAAATRKARTGGALLSGAIVGFEILMRTSSQVYAPLPWLLAVEGRGGFGRVLAWTLLYALAAAGPLAPWVLHNYDEHGVYAVSASTGRNLYFNAVWSGTIDREKEVAKYGLGHAPTPRAAYPLADRALQKQLAAGLSLPEADAKLGEIAREAYAAKDWRTLGRERAAIVRDLFVPATDPGAASLSPLRRDRDWYLTNRNATSQVRDMLSERFRYRFSDAYVTAASKRRAPQPLARTAYERWIDFLTVDGAPLLIAFALSAAVIVLRSRLRAPLAIVLVLPPLAFLGAFAFFGAPLYRYQAGLHPFMLAAVATACGILLASPRKRLPRGTRMHRRLAGYGQDFWS